MPCFVVNAHTRYGALLFSVVEPAWRAMAQGYLLQHATPHGPVQFNKTALAEAIADYDVRLPVV
jgi:hypothetical protein